MNNCPTCEKHVSNSQFPTKILILNFMVAFHDDEKPHLYREIPNGHISAFV